MGDKRRDELALRAITVSGRVAISKARTPEEVEAITDRMDNLLADLEAIVIQDGGDEQILEGIEAARRGQI